MTWCIKLSEDTPLPFTAHSLRPGGRFWRADASRAKLSFHNLVEYILGQMCKMCMDYLLSINSKLSFLVEYKNFSALIKFLWSKRNDCPAHEGLVHSGCLMPNGSLWELESPTMCSKTNFHFASMKITEKVNMWQSPRSVLPHISIMIWDYLHRGKFGSNARIIIQTVWAGHKSCLVSKHLHVGWNNFTYISDMSLLPISLFLLTIFLFLQFAKGL